MAVEELWAEALRLPRELRAALADRLLESLEGGEPDSERNAAWAAELSDRIAAWRRGELKPLSEQEFFERLDSQTDAVARS